MPAFNKNGLKGKCLRTQSLNNQNNFQKEMCNLENMQKAKEVELKYVLEGKLCFVNE